MPLPNFPQKGQLNSPQVFEMPADAPASIQQWVAKIRFTTPFVRWFGSLTAMTNGAGDDSALVETGPAAAAPDDALDAAVGPAPARPAETSDWLVQVAAPVAPGASDWPPLADTRSVPSDAPGELQRSTADATADLAVLLGATNGASLSTALAALADGQSALAQLAALPALAYGTYTPTLSDDANITASTAYACQYVRVGQTVTVSGKVNVTPTAISTYTQLGISLPVASAFSAAEQCGGTASSLTATLAVNQNALIGADATNKRAVMAFGATDATAEDFFFTFTYQIL